MPRILFLLFVIASLSLVTPSFAQEEIVLGGKAYCRVIGNAPFKKFVGDANRFTFLESSTATKASIQIQNIRNVGKVIFDVNMRAFLGDIPDRRKFLSGSLFKNQSSSSDIEIKKILVGENKTFELNNFIGDDNRYFITSRIKVVDKGNNTISGILRILLDKSTFLETASDETISSDINNGRIIIICRLKNIPFETRQVGL